MKKNILIVLSLALLLGVFSNLSAQTLLWTEDFSATPPAGWTVVNAGAGNNWNLTATYWYPYSGYYYMQYNYNVYSSANTWAFTPGISMIAGNDYYLTFFQKVSVGSFPENLKVTVGNAQTVASQTSTVLDLASVTNTGYIKRTTANYRPTTSGTYYFAFNCYSYKNRRTLCVDYVQAFEKVNTGIANPTAFTAKASSSPQINLSWTRNSTPDNVLLAWNTTNTFGIPSGSYNPGDQISGGGTVLLANSSATSFDHSGLNPNTTYYYKIWSQDGAGTTYSSGLFANATTQMAPVTSFPWEEDLTNVTPPGSLPAGWSQMGMREHWSTSDSNGAGGTSPEFYFDRWPEETGTFRLITPPLDGSVCDLMLSFNHSIAPEDIPATYAVQYTTDGGNTWHTLWSVADLTSIVGPKYQVIDLSAIDTVFQLAWVYEGYSFNTNGWVVDDISVRLAGPEQGVSESYWDFGLAYYDTGSNCTPHYFLIENRGAGTVTIANAPQFTGTDASHFTLIDANTYPIVLYSSQSASWGVKFTPGSFGEKTAYLSITDGTGTTSDISLRGFGVMNVFEDYFESYGHCSGNLSPWTQYDGDTAPTVVLGDDQGNLLVDSYIGSFICLDFNSFSPQPGATWSPYSGDRYAVCVAADGPANDDWLITKQLSFRESPRISFFARSLYREAQLCSFRDGPMGSFNVLYSTTGNSYTDFGTNYLNSPQPQTVGFDWTLFEYELPAVCANNDNVYIAIQCVPEKMIMLMIDDFVAGDYYNAPTPVELSSFTASSTVGNFVSLTWVTQSETGVQGFYILRNTQDDLPHATVISPLVLATNTSQQQVYTYTDKDLSEDGTYYYWLQNSDMDGGSNYYGPVSIDYTVQGSSTPEIPLVTELKPVFPNPFNPIAYIPYSIGKNEGPADVNFRIYNSRGQLVYSQDVKNQNTGTHQIQWHGKDNNGNACGTGLYFIHMNVGAKSYVRKAVLMK